MPNIQSEIEFVKAMLPSHYNVKESNTKGSIHCSSRYGIRLPPFYNNMGTLVDDADDPEAWEYFTKALEQKFGDRLQEIDHNVCSWHSDFTIYIKSPNVTDNNR